MNEWTDLARWLKQVIIKRKGYTKRGGCQTGRETWIILVGI